MSDMFINLVNNSKLKLFLEDIELICGLSLTMVDENFNLLYAAGEKNNTDKIDMYKKVFETFNCMPNKANVRNECICFKSIDYFYIFHIEIIDNDQRPIHIFSEPFKLNEDDYEVSEFKIECIDYKVSQYQCKRIDAKEIKCKKLKLVKNFLTHAVQWISEVVECTQDLNTDNNKRIGVNLKQITDNTIYMIVLADINGIYEYITPSVKSILGYDVDYMIGKNVFEFLHPDDMEYILKEYTEMLKTHATKKVKCRYRKSNDSYIWMEIEGRLIHDDNNIKAVYSLADITKQVEVEKSLIKSEEKYKKLVEFLPVAVTIQKSGAIIFANNIASQLLGFENPEEIVGKNVDDLVEFDWSYNREINEKNHDLLFKTGVMPGTEQKYRLIKNGKIKYLETTIQSFPELGDDAWIFVSRDISEKKMFEELDEKVKEKTRLLDKAREYDRLKTEFMINISHELRTPISVIQSAYQMISILADKLPVSEETLNMKRYGKIIKQNCNRMVRLVSNLIDSSRLDYGFYSLNLENCNIVSYIEDITQSVVEFAESKGLSLVFDTNIEEKVMACDMEKVERVILNLLSNAIKFTPSGGKILVKIVDENEYLSIIVKDTGIGIPGDKHEKIFERFIQVDKSLSRSCEGSGIGLSLVKSFVEMHGGEVYVRSKCGIGSMFTVRMPVKVLEDEDSLGKQGYYDKDPSERVNIEFSDIYI